MSLEECQKKKRDFEISPEPEGNIENKRCSNDDGICRQRIYILEDINKNRKYLTHNEKRGISIQPEKTKCLSHQHGRNCPLDNNDADPNTFCEAYKQGDGYICNAIAKDDPVEDDYSEQSQPTVLHTYIR